MLKIRFEGFDRLQKQIEGVGDKARRAAAEAMTRTAKDVQSRERAEINRVFDKPTPWVQNSVFVKPATKQRLEATVWIKDEAGGKGTPSSKVLQAEIDGGSRRQKRSEKALQSVGVLPAGWVAVPTKWAKLDAYGNMQRGQIVQILSHLRAQIGSGYESRLGGSKFDAEKVKKRIAKTGVQYVAVRVGTKNNLAPGVYETQAGRALGRRIRPVMIFAPLATYRVRYRFHAIADEVIQRDLNNNFNETLQRYLREDGMT